MFSRGVEHGVVTAGFDQWPGDVTRLVAEVLPHMGWNTVQPSPDSALFRGLESESFYFVHSYAAAALELETTSPSCGHPR